MKKTFRALILIALLPVLIACGGGSGTSALFGVIPGEASKTSNAIPIANAGLTQNVKAASTVTLDGTEQRREQRVIDVPLANGLKTSRQYCCAFFFYLTQANLFS
jgi:hypothetical protein